MVIFADGLIPLGGDEFIVTYGAADSDVGPPKSRSRCSRNTLRQVLPLILP